jgi:hypothetical protein
MEEIGKSPQHTDELNEMLLVLDKNDYRIRAVKSITKDGAVETVEPEEKSQADFMRVERGGDFFSNFFTNYMRQLKEPTRFDFFRVPYDLGIAIAQELQAYLNDLGKDAQNLFSKYALNSEYQHKNHIHMETTQSTSETNEYRFKPEQVNWESLSNLGISKERLEKMNLIEPLLKGFKTNDLIPLTLTMGDAVAKLDARLSLQQNDAGQVVVAMHGIRKEPNLNYPFFGHEFTPEDKENLLKTGNMGRVVDLFNQKSSEFIPSVISVDRKTNELVAYKAEWMQIPDEIKGVKLDDIQKQLLQEGKPLHLEGMISKKGESFEATVQFNADKRFVEFLFDRNPSANQTQKIYDEAPREFRGKELTDEQYNKLKDGLTVYISGLVDKQGKEYNGYITYNSESGKVGFSFNNPSKSKEQAMPGEDHKTQVAVNSEGKTNESTKNANEPLKSGQAAPDSAKQQEQQEQPVKSKGRKM